MKTSSKSLQIRTKIKVQDSVFLCFIIMLSIVPYIQKLGFYSDDWAMLGYLNTLKDQSLLGLIRLFIVSGADMWPRPIEAVYQALLYWLFGIHPLGYHLFNSIVLMAGIVLLYWVLQELDMNRWISLTVPVIYGLLPHYSTDRFWYASFQANLCMVLYFISLYSDLKSISSPQKIQWRWKIISIISILGSVLAYEIFLPLFIVLNPLIIFYRKRQLSRTESGSYISQANLVVQIGINLLFIIVAVIFKFQVTTRQVDYSTPVGVKPFLNRLFNVSIVESLHINFDEYGLRLPQVIGKIIESYQNIEILTISGVGAIIVFLYLYYRIACQLNIDLPRWRNTAGLIILGLAISSLSFSYLLRWNTPTGIENRFALAAALGVAFVQVGGCGLVSSLLNPKYLRKGFFCILISLLCFCGILINNTIAEFWINASQKQQMIVADLRKHIPHIAPDSTLILDGFCPYIGPGIVFETNWDVQGILRIIYSDRTLKGDVVQPNLKVKKDGISTFIYGDENYHPYNQLFIYNFAKKMTYQLTDAETANSYFAKFNSDYSNGCPEGQPGKGVSIF